MKIPACSYFLFWASLSVVFSRLGLIALDKTDISHSVSPLILSLFKHLIAASTYFSSLYAFLFYTPLKFSFYTPHTVAEIAAFTAAYAYLSRNPLSFWGFSLFVGNISVNFLYSFILLDAHLVNTQRALVDLGVGSPILLAGNKDRLLTCVVPSIALFVTVSWLIDRDNVKFRELLASLGRAHEYLSTMAETKVGKVVEFGIGLAGTVFFQHYFKLTSMPHVVAFLFFAVAWLANRALFRASDDTGMFYFVITNVMVGYTVGQYGLQWVTWLVWAASLMLFGLRQWLKSVTFVESWYVSYASLNFWRGPPQLGLPEAIGDVE